MKKIILLWIIAEILLYCFGQVEEQQNPEELRSYGNEYVREIVIEEEQIQETFIDEIFIQDI